MKVYTQIPANFPVQYFPYIGELSDDVVIERLNAKGSTAAGAALFNGVIQSQRQLLVCKYVDSSNFALALTLPGSGGFGMVVEVYAEGGSITVFPDGAGVTTFLDGASSKTVSSGMRFIIVPNVDGAPRFAALG